MTAKSLVPSIKSVTIIRQDVLSGAGAGIQAAERLARFLQSVALLMIPAPSPDKSYMDVTTSQTHTFELDATENPVQNGTTITDHSRRLPDEFSCECLLVDTPLFPPTPIQLGRANRNWEQLFGFFKAREPVFIATSIRVYPSMLLRRLVVTRETDSGSAIAVSILAREIRIAQSLVAIPLVDDGAAVAGASPATNLGTQTGVSI